MRLAPKLYCARWLVIQSNVLIAVSLALGNVNINNYQAQISIEVGGLALSLFQYIDLREDQVVNIAHNSTVTRC